MGKEIELMTGIPIVSITYDGSGGNKNDAIIPYLKFPRTRRSKPETGKSNPKPLAV